MVRAAWLTAAVMAALHRASPGLQWPCPPGSPQHLQLGAAPAAGRVAGGVTVRSLLRKFKPVPGSHRVLIKYTNIVAVVAVLQLSGTMSGECGVVEAPLGLGG